MEAAKDIMRERPGAVNNFFRKSFGAGPRRAGEQRGAWDGGQDGGRDGAWDGGQGGGAGVLSEVACQRNRGRLTAETGALANLVDFWTIRQAISRGFFKQRASDLAVYNPLKERRSQGERKIVQKSPKLAGSTSAGKPRLA